MFRNDCSADYAPLFLFGAAPRIEADQSRSWPGWHNAATSNQEFAMSRTVFGKFAIAAIAALSLSACVQSQVPLITDAQPLLGQQFEVHLYEDFVDNKASGVHASTYQWKDGQYVRAGGLAQDAKRFVAQPLAGNDFVIQSSDENGKTFLYWIGRRLTPGVYQIFGIDEMDADEATRKKICGERSDGICQVATRDQLLTMARATAAKPPRNTALGVVLSRPASF
jgi:hypothetical protein